MSSSFRLSVPQCQMDDSQILDLHGFTKERAIEKVTFFLDQIRHKHLYSLSNSPAYVHPSTMPVTIITGSGKHSQSGPVLRQAVEKILTKRQMSFRLNHGKGSFLVDAFSGVELNLRDDLLCPTDSKVLVKRRPAGNKNVKLVNRPDNTLFTRTLTHSSTGSIDSTHGNNDMKTSSIDESSVSLPIAELLSMPTPSEAKRDEEQLSNAMQLSEKEASKQFSLLKKESSHLQKATEDSLRTHEEIEEERRILSEILEQSKIEEEQQRMSEEEMIEQVLKMSQQEVQSESKQERLELERVLALSEQDQRNSNHYIDEDADDLLLLEALKVSKSMAKSSSNTSLNGENLDSSDDVDAEFERQLKIALEESTRCL